MRRKDAVRIIQTLLFQVYLSDQTLFFFFLLFYFILCFFCKFSSLSCQGQCLITQGFDQSNEGEWRTQNHGSHSTEINTTLPSHTHPSTNPPTNTHATSTSTHHNRAPVSFLVFLLASLSFCASGSLCDCVPVLLFTSLDPAHHALDLHR